MGIYIPTISGLHSKEATTCTGTTATEVFATVNQLQSRAAVQIHNADASISIWVLCQNRGTAAPTMSITNKTYVIPAGSTLDIAVGSSVDVYLQNASGAATTTAYVAYEVLS